MNTSAKPLLAILAAASLASCRGAAARDQAPPAAARVADGRMPLPELQRRLLDLTYDKRWHADTVYEYPGGDKIIALRSRGEGKALWILAGIHGEEPAGPNAVVRALGSLTALADEGVPIVLIAVCNPKGYRNNWRYPNTPERDWRKGGYSVGDAEYLLPDLKKGEAPRVAAPVGPEAKALTEYVLRLSSVYPPQLVLDLHEDELSKDGGYIYSQGASPKDSPVGAEIIRLLRASGIPIRLSGKTRFGEPVEDGMVSRDDQGLPIRDGSIDELFASAKIFKDGKPAAGPAAPTVIVVETPAFAGSDLSRRIGAQAAVLDAAAALWKLGGRP